MCPVRDPHGRYVRVATAAGRLLVFREVGGEQRAYGCTGCTGIARHPETGLRGGISEADVVSFLALHPRPYVHIVGAWDGPGRFPIHVPFMLEEVERGESALDIYCRGPGGFEWIRVTVRLRRWPPPYIKPEV